MCTINLSENEIGFSHYSINVYNLNVMLHGRCSFVIGLNTSRMRHIEVSQRCQKFRLSSVTDWKFETQLPFKDMALEDSAVL